MEPRANPNTASSAPFNPPEAVSAETPDGMGAAATGADAAVDERVSTIVGDRVCASCGFNLFGQPIFRERHYQMLMARCPECGAAAALHEYPLLGKWAGRWAKILAALWFLAMLILLLASSGILAGFAESVTSHVCTPLARRIAMDFEKHYDANRSDYEQSRFSPGFYSDFTPHGSRIRYVEIDPRWWEDEGREAIRSAGLGLSERYDWPDPASTGWFIFWVGVIGGFWAILAPHARWRRMLFIAAFIVGFTLLWLVSFSGLDSQYYGMGAWAGDLAERFAGWPVRYAAVSFAIVPLLAGMLLGRPAARVIVIALLPPRMRGWLAFLWLADNKHPPHETWIDR